MTPKITTTSAVCATQKSRVWARKTSIVAEPKPSFSEGDAESSLLGSSKPR
jgi:hypothetical protein